MCVSQHDIVGSFYITHTHNSAHAFCFSFSALITSRRSRALFRNPSSDSTVCSNPNNSIHLFREIYMDKGYQESGDVNVERNVGDNQYNEDGNVGVNKRLKDVQVETVMQTEQCEELRSHDSNLPKGEVGEGSFESLPRVAQPELYPGCKMSPSSFLSRLFHLKDTNRWSDESVDMLLEVLKDAVPEGGKMPGSHIEAKILMRDLGRDEHNDHKDHKSRTGGTDDDARELHGQMGAKSSHASATSRGKKKEKRKSRKNYM